MLSQHALRVLVGPVPGVLASGVEPVVGGVAVAYLRVDVLALHQLQGLGRAQEVAGTGDHIGYELGRQGLLVDFDASHGAVDRAEHVVVDHQGLQRATQDAGQHPGRLVHQVGAGLTGQGNVDALLVAGLVVGDLGVGHARGHPRRQAQPVDQLGRGRVQDALLARAAAHGAGSQVRHERPHAHHARMARVQQVHPGQRGQALGQGLGQ